MPCRLGYGWARCGNTVPYPPSHGRVGHGRKRNNRGFLDLRGKPEAAANVAEAAESPELGAWLVELATAGSKLFSLGCDLGNYRKRKVNAGLPRATGGYVQVLAADYAHWTSNEYKAVAENVAPRIESAAGEDDWTVNFVLQTVQFNLDGFHDEAMSLTVEFNAWGTDKQLARDSRERLIRTLRLEYRDIA